MGAGLGTIAQGLAMGETPFGGLNSEAGIELDSDTDTSISLERDITSSKATEIKFDPNIRVDSTGQKRRWNSLTKKWDIIP